MRNADDLKSCESKQKLKEKEYKKITNQSRWTGYIPFWKKIWPFFENCMSYVEMYLTIESLDYNEEQHTEETSRKRSVPLYEILYHEKLKTTNNKNKNLSRNNELKIQVQRFSVFWDDNNWDNGWLRLRKFVCDIVDWVFEVSGMTIDETLGMKKEQVLVIRFAVVVVLLLLMINHLLFVEDFTFFLLHAFSSKNSYERKFSCVNVFDH